MNIFRVENLEKRFPAGKNGLFGKNKWIHAVDGVSIAVRSGETLGLVGESGCGKSTFGRTMLKLIEPTAGRLYFKDEEISLKRPGEMKPLRKKMQMIFQDPYASLNPRMTVGDIVGEPLTVHHICRTSAEKRERIRNLLEKVGFQPNYADRYPGEFSGGQRQRIMIARVLATQPELVVADEAVSALDVSIQSQILNLLCDLQDDFGLSYVFISHDLGVVKFISDRIAVMYMGRIVELADSNELYERPLHPYTQILLQSIPTINGDRSEKIRLTGEIPSAMDYPQGCAFESRCKRASRDCAVGKPELKEITPEHYVSCFLY
ncbi:MAG TPA: ATP-binding cassette domain-containing protein [Thermotogota bacterium]|nr:ATP-binding cassette domain-containing protein [Thermotogota bacterium]HPR96277.1 ATP-binding cassette domain-containing protein [Thermotogota bacterium]